MKALTSNRFLSTCRQAVFLLTMPFLWLVLILLELFLAFFPINNAINYELYTIILLMHFLEKKFRSEELVVIRQNKVIQSSRSHYYYEDQQQESEQAPGLVVYELLLNILRKQTRKPFQLFKQFIFFSDEESSIEVGYKHGRYELEIIEENIRAACTLIRQRLLIDGFLTIKNAYMKKIRIEQAYYNEQNIEILHSSISNFQHFFLKWQGFGKLYQNYRGYRLSKLNLSKIQAISNDYTSKQLEDFHPFLTERGERQREIETIHSYIIDRSQNQSNLSNNDLIEKHFNGGGNKQKDRIKEHQNYEVDEIQKIQKRSLKKSSTELHYLHKVEDNDQELESKILITHKKQADLKQAETTPRPAKDLREIDSQQVYLIRDYRKRTTPPTSFIKVPVLSENIKIIEVQTRKKKSSKRRITKEQVEIQQDICQNCKFCIQLRQRKQSISTIQRRTVILKSDNLFQSFSS